MTAISFEWLWFPITSHFNNVSFWFSWAFVAIVSADCVSLSGLIDA